MALRPLMSDAEIKRRKKLQGKVSVTTSTLGLAALGLKGAGGVARASRFGAKGAKFANSADKAATNTLIGSAGVGGLGGYNFAAYTRAESRKRQPVKKDFTMIDFGGDIHKALTPIGAAPKKPTTGIKPMGGPKAPTPGAGPKAPTPVKPPVAGVGAFGPKGYQPRQQMGKAFKPPTKKVADTLKTVTGAASDFGTTKKKIVKKSVGMNIEEHKRRARDLRRTHKRGERTVSAGTSLASGAIIHQAYLSNNRQGPFSQAHSQGQMVNRARKQFGGVNTAKKVGSWGPKLVRAYPHGTAMYGAGALVAGGAATMGIARSREKKHDVAIKQLRKQNASKVQKNQEIFKAYDPERNRERRTNAYSTGLAFGSGAAATGALIHTKKAKALGSLYRNPAYRSAAKHGGKAAALTTTAVAAGIASNRIKSYKKKSGGRYTPLHSSGF